MSSEHGHNNHPPHLAHHFETPKQQFESGKLGMWVFLATEILMFGGLFCAYAIYRGNHQDVFLYGYGALNKYWGATNTVVLLASSLTMAWGVRAAQKGQQKLLLAMLIATFMGGVGFMCIKTIEYKAKWDHDLFPGTMNAFYYKNGAPAYPDKLEHAIAYIDSHNTGGHAPAHGGDHGEHAADAHAEAPAHDEHAAPEAASEAAAEAHAKADESHSAVIIPAAFGAPADVSLIPHPAVSTETGVLDSAIDNAGVTVLPHAGHTQRTWASLSTEEQGKVHLFFSIYFLMTGLHGLHVLIGMGVIAWLIWKAAKGTFGKEYFTPVDIGGLYWHLVDLIWIFLFPLLYLIH
jgi:cytochrome c oxidase subunit 3